MKYKEFEWVRKVIESCETFTQASTPITRLIQLFDKRWNDTYLFLILIRTKHHKLQNLTRIVHGSHN